MDARERYEERARAAIAQVRTQLDELRVQADLAQKEARTRLEQALDALSRRTVEAREQVDEADQSVGEAWKSLASRAEATIDDLGEQVERVMEQVQTAVGAAGAAARAAATSFRDEWNRQRAERTSLLDDA